MEFEVELGVDAGAGVKRRSAGAQIEPHIAT